MTEFEWLLSQDPAAMLLHLKEASDRKLRLFACACVRRVWHLLTDPRSRNAVIVAEKFADGLATKLELAAAWEAAQTAAREATQGATGAVAWEATGEAAWAATRTAGEAAWAAREAAGAAAREATGEATSNLLRDIVGNPFRQDLYWEEVIDGRRLVQVLEILPPDGTPGNLGGKVFQPVSWLTPQVLSLAQAAYDEPLEDGTLDPFRLALISDALEESGCDRPALLAHSRSPGPHVRGCWALDLILGET